MKIFMMDVDLERVKIDSLKHKKLEKDIREQLSRIGSDQVERVKDGWQAFVTDHERTLLTIAFGDLVKFAIPHELICSDPLEELNKFREKHAN